MSKNFTIAICSYNAAHLLPGLVGAFRRQRCPLDAEILVVDNNSTDGTRAVVAELAGDSATPIRYVQESAQGISFARNRAIQETLSSNYLVFIDTDELPAPGWLETAADALGREGADCVGGAIRVRLPTGNRPQWLIDELLGFLGEVDYGVEPFWISDRSTPVWSGNVAYNTNVFASGLRFDDRYNRRGEGVGGGEDAIMFRALLSREARIRYRPEMHIDHIIGPKKLRRRYFLKLHYSAGRRFGEFETPDYARTFFGIPPFMLPQAFSHALTTARLYLSRDPHAVRQAMNLVYALGTIVGRTQRWRTPVNQRHSAKDGFD
ncbi:glycosyltransferase family 2 protein [Gammaproteobacteria bacterium]|nr:glycosyltransferase family 2 protein [Gammaproteobacteria bacterium]